MKKLKPIIILTVIAASILAFVMWLNKYSEAEDTLEKLRIIADAFTIPGVLIAGMGALIWASMQGIFDGIAFGFKHGAHILLPRILPEHENFYDYKMKKQEKREKTTIHRTMMIYGAVMVVISLLIIFIRQAMK